MAKKWCECNKCDGGSLVSRPTWYRHQKKAQTRSSRPPRDTPAQRNLFLNPASEPLIDIGANEPGEANPLDDVEYPLRSDTVSAIH